jgi:hypothetical protein
MLIVGFLACASFSMPAWSQDAPAKEKFYNFDDMLIDGEFKTPQGMYENARIQAKFDRLLKLKKSFLPKIQETAKEDALAN